VSSVGIALGSRGTLLAAPLGMMPPVSRYCTMQPWTIDRHATLADAHALMREHAIRHLPVLDHGRLVGVVSLHDLHLLETIAEFSLDSVDVEEAMTEHPFVVRLKWPIDEVVEIMAKRKFGCAIVVGDDDAVLGIFTTIDALQAFAHVLHREEACA
jgi:acetoin utilization protein AcuB